MSSVRQSRPSRKASSSSLNTQTRSKPQPLYDDNGKLIANGLDLCDCGVESCTGCHFPCKKCYSHKCGHVCRRKRTWQYDHANAIRQCLPRWNKGSEKAEVIYLDSEEEQPSTSESNCDVPAMTTTTVESEMMDIDQTKAQSDF